MPNTGIEPATLRSLARRFNQLSYATATFRIYIGKAMKVEKECWESREECLYGFW